MKALISKIEPRQTGWRIAQVEPDDKIFPVAADFFWVNCADHIVADQHWYDPVDNTIKDMPATVVTPAGNQPVSNGAQTL
jgi:hypothetical protein